MWMMGRKGEKHPGRRNGSEGMTAAPFQEPEQAKGMRSRTLGTDFLLQSLTQYTFGKDSQVRLPWARIPLSPHSESLDRPLSPHPPSVKCRRQHFLFCLIIFRLRDAVYKAPSTVRGAPTWDILSLRTEGGLWDNCPQTFPSPKRYVRISLCPTA